MAILDLFSTRQKRERGGTTDVFVYDQLPRPLRVQVIYILQDALGTPTIDRYATPALEVYQGIVDRLCRHFGRITLAVGVLADEQLANFILSESDIDRCIDAIELSCRMIEQFGKAYDYADRVYTKLSPGEAIADLNHRFLEHGVGYQYISGQMIRTDSEFLHAEVVKPTLALLQDKRYHGANDEFLKGHDNYRKGEVKDCLVNCLKALESTLKTICKARGWAFQPTATAKTLLDIALKKA